MEERRPRIIRDEVDVHLSEARHNDGVLEHACGRLAVYAHKLERVSVQMHRMRIIGEVLEREAVTASLLNLDRRAVLELLAIDGPAVEIFRAAVDLAERHGNCLIGRGHCTRGAEERVVPRSLRRRDPAWRAGATSILDDDPHAVTPVVVLRRTQDPHSGVVHLHDRVDSLRHAQGENAHLARCGHRVAIKRDHLELVTGQRELDILRCARVQDAEHHALTPFDPHRFAVAE